MKIQRVIPVFLSLILSSCAQKPHPCRAPLLFEGKLTVLVPGQKIQVFEKFYYNAIRQNIRVLAYGKEGNKTISTDRLLLYREGVRYDIHHHNKTCVKSALKVRFEPVKIPHDARFLQQMVLGSSSRPGEGLLINNWHRTVSETKENYFMTFTEFGCMPLHIVSLTEKLHVDVVSRSVFRLLCPTQRHTSVST